MAAAASASQKQYEEFEPSTEIVQEQDCDTILLHLPGFTREKLRVQLTSTKILRVSGEREVENNKWIRFQTQFPVSSNYDTNKISSKFEKGILYIRQPKLITPEDNKQDNKLPAAAAEPQPQKNVQQNPAEKTSPRDDGPSKKTDVQDVPQKKLEKEDQMVNDKKSNETKYSKSLDKKIQEEKTSSTSAIPENDTAKAADKDNGTSEVVGGSGKTRIDSYKGTAVDLAANLKSSRRLVNVFLVVLLAVVLGSYIANFVRSFRRTDEN